jgi:hypothetical protein
MMFGRVLRSPHLRWAAPLTAVAVASAVGLWGGWPPALMVLALIALLTVIGLFWNSVQGLAGESPLTLEEALTLGAPSAEEEQKRALLRALNDLKYERSVGKISEDDYAELSQRYREQAKRLMQQLEGEQVPARKRAEQLLRRRLVKAGLLPETKKRKSAKAANEAAPPIESDEVLAKAEAETSDRTDNDSAPEAAPSNGESKERASPRRRCPGCEKTNDLDARFCKHCGKSLAVEGETLCGACPAAFDSKLEECPACGTTREIS